MSLKAFHVFFMLVSIVLCAAVGAWAFTSWRGSGAPLELGMAITSGAGGLGLAAYLRSFLRKWKRVSYL
jgi:hypothetical protein